MQGSAWAEHRRAQGADPRFVTFSDGRVALVVLRHQRLSPGLVATCRRGPARADLTGTELAGHVALLGDAMRELGARELSVDPELDADAGYEAAMDALGARPTEEFQPSIHVMRLTFADDATEGSVFAGIQKATRQRIRAAERAGTTVRYDETGERLAEFGELLVERADALGIAMRPERGNLAAWLDSSRPDRRAAARRHDGARREACCCTPGRDALHGLLRRPCGVRRSLPAPCISCVGRSSVTPHAGARRRWSWRCRPAGPREPHRPTSQHGRYAQRVVRSTVGARTRPGG